MRAMYFTFTWSAKHQVEGKSVVLPNETEGLYIERGRDLVTLVTCTPYGVNTHRLLVRGTRIDYDEAQIIVDNTENVIVNTWLSQYIYAVLIGIAISAVVIAVIFVVYRRVNSENKKEQSP